MLLLGRVQHTPAAPPAVKRNTNTLLNISSFSMQNFPHYGIHRLLRLTCYMQALKGSLHPTFETNMAMPLTYTVAAALNPPAKSTMPTAP